MYKKITNSTSVNTLGLSASKLLFEISSGVYSGRVISLFQSSPGTIQYSYSDKPNNIFSTPSNIITDCDDKPFDAVMDTSFNVHLIYTKVTAGDLMYVKLSFADGVWTAGTPVTVFNADDARNPSVVIDNATSNLYVAWSRDQSGSYTLCVKSSTDGGATWGTGPADTGDILTAGSSSIFPKLLVGVVDLLVIYTDGSLEIDFRSQALTGGSWTGEFIIASGTNFDNNFDAAVSTDGLLSVVFDNQQLRYREYDGDNWGPLVVLDSTDSYLPQLFFINNIPFIVYTIKDSSEQLLLKYISRSSGTFSTPKELDNSSGYFDSLFLYDLSAATYSDLTSEAQSVTSADIFHPSSSAVFKDVGDNAYLGMDSKFRYLFLILFTAGIGGTLQYSYWDGSNWKSFVPASGAYDFDATEKRLLLWDDYVSMPSDWQKTTVNGSDRFWVKVEVTASFSTAPVGTQLTTISDIHSFLVRR